MSEKPEQKMPAWALPLVSWVVSLYFLLGFAKNVGFPPDRRLFAGDGLYVLLWLFFLFLPFFTKIKIGGFLELEREVARAKEELRDFKSEIRNSMSVLSTNVNTIGGMTNQVTVNIPGLAELREARRTFDAEVPPRAKQTAEQVEERILLQSEDTTLALARTRIEIERLLRKILGKQASLSPGKEQAVRFLGINRLFEIFIAQNEQLAYLTKPFRYITQVCNAAIHSRSVTAEQAQEVLALGAQMISVLKEIAGETE